MRETNSRSTFLRRSGNLLALIGFATYLAGLFGPVRNVLFVGIVLIVVSFIAFFFEEQTSRT